MVVAICSAIVAIIGLIVLIWNKFWSHEAQLRALREKELENAKNAKDASELNSDINDINNRL